MNNILLRITLPWTFTRALYLIMGGVIMVFAIYDKLWLGSILGGYFLAKGLFAWGCASGDCALPADPKDTK